MNSAPSPSHLNFDRDAGLVESLAGLNASGEMRAAEKTRRAVMGAVIQMREQRTERRRSCGIALLVCAVLLVLLSPVIWGGVDEWIGGASLGDLQAQMTLLALVVFPALLAALFAGWQSARPHAGPGRRRG